MDAHVQKALEDTNWDALTDSLLRYAAFLTSARDDNLALDHDGLHDLVYDAIEKLLDGTRKWEPEPAPGKKITLRMFLKGIIRSTVHHRRKKLADRPETQRMGADQVPEKRTDRALTDAGCEAGQAVSSGIAEMSDLPYEARFRRRLADSIHGDSELERVVRALEDGVNVASKMAQSLKLDIDKVYDLKRKLKRRALSIKKKMDEEERGGER